MGTALVASVGIPTIETGEIALRLGVAGALSAAIGLERELRERAAGLRTHMMVGLGAALFTLISAYGFSGFFEGGAESVVRADPTRIAAQIVTGIGFLGAGAIIRNGLSVRGLTTAATLWIVAAIGLCAGAGFYTGAVIATVLALVGLGPMRVVERWIITRTRSEHTTLVVTLAPGTPSSRVLRAAERAGCIVQSITARDGEDARHLRIETDLPPGTDLDAACDAISAVEGVQEVTWET